MQVTFKVYRKDPEKDGKPGRSNYALELPEDATVMDALLKIRDESDTTLLYQEGPGDFTRPAAQRSRHQGPRFRLGRLHVE